MPSGTILVRHRPNPSSEAGEWRWWHTIGVNLMILAGSSLSEVGQLPMEEAELIFMYAISYTWAPWADTSRLCFIEQQWDLPLKSSCRKECPITGVVLL